MTRLLTIAGTAAILALPVAAPALACPAHDHTAQASTVDLAAASKKALTPTVQSDKAEQAQTPAK